MPTLYLLEPETRLEKEHGRLLVTKEDEVLMRVPLKNVDQVVLVGYAGATTQALHALLRNGIPLFLTSQSGGLLGRLSPPTGYNLELRKAQYRRNEEVDFTIRFSRQVVKAKIHNQAVLADRISRRRVKASAEKLNSLDEAARAAGVCDDMETLLGIEGSAASIYFQIYQAAFDPAWSFKRRTRRPPKDPVNALLSLGYTLLGYALMTALEIVGLDPYLGYFHQEAYGRPALALDLLEEFRAPFVDSLVMGLINRRLLKMGDFKTTANEGVLLTQRGMRVFLREFSDRLEASLTPRSVGRSLSYRKLFEVQARRIANFISGKSGTYTPFLAR